MVAQQISELNKEERRMWMMARKKEGNIFFNKQDYDLALESYVTAM